MPLWLEGRHSTRARRFEKNATSATHVIDVVCDASVAVKWFREEGEDQLREARAILAAHSSGQSVFAAVLDLTVYELANVLLRRHRANPAAVARAIELLHDACSPLAPSPAELRRAAELAQEQALSFYDASYAAVAQQRGAVLATTDQQLLDAGLGESPRALVARLALRPEG